jgi:2-amino-4-hydroxy-6-hydroxymethyldihydropteridine diphosphokinase
MKTVFLGLGSNLGDRQRALQEALERLHGPDLCIRRVSSVYETEPVDCAPQGWFFNAVAEAETRLFPVQLLQRLLRIEAEMGRKRARGRVNAPRVIDLDLLFYGQWVIHTAALTVPHPRMHLRRFVLEPLAELAPEWRHPGLRRSVAELLREAGPQRVRKTDGVLHAPEAFSP